MLLYFSSRLNDNDYDYVASERLGRTKAYQEQYVFVFRYVFCTLYDYDISFNLSVDIGYFIDAQFSYFLHFICSHFNSVVTILEFLTSIRYLEKYRYSIPFSIPGREKNCHNIKGVNYYYFFW